MKLRGVLRIGTTLGVALVLAVLVRNLFMAATAEPPPAKFAERLVAPVPMPPGLLLAAEDLAWEQIPDDTAQSGEILKHSAAAVKLAGAVVRRPIEAGSAIREQDIVFPDAPGFLAAALKPGMRAVSVAIDDVTGNAGLIQPGDRVDLLLTHMMDADNGRQERKVASETVLADLRVIAVGSVFRQNDGGAGTDPAAARGAHQQQARTVTLEVTPHDAEKVAVVIRLGNLSLSLRSLATPRPESDAAAVAVETAPLWGKDVSAVVRMTATRSGAPRPTATAAAPPQIQVFRGSKRDSATETMTAAK